MNLAFRGPTRNWTVPLIMLRSLNNLNRRGKIECNSILMVEQFTFWAKKHDFLGFFARWKQKIGQRAKLNCWSNNSLFILLWCSRDAEGRQRIKTRPYSCSLKNNYPRNFRLVFDWLSQSRLYILLHSLRNAWILGILSNFNICEWIQHSLTRC